MSLFCSPAVDPAMRRAAEDADRAGRSAMAERHIRYCHVHGVLGVAESEGMTDLLDSARVEGLLVIRTSGGLCRSLTDVAAGNPAGGDFMKIGYSGNIEDEDDPGPRMGQEDLCRILRERGGRKAVVVANGRRQVAEAIEAGCDAIEQGYGLGEENLKRMASKGIVWIPSLARARTALDASRAGGEVCCRFSQRYAAPGKPIPGAEAFWKKALGEQLACLRLARELGVAVAMGTGAGGVGLLHGESMVEEMKLFIKAGYSLEEAIRCASETGARLFGLETLGALAVGRRATFLIVRGAVQQLPRKLAYLEGIYVDGEPSPLYRKNPVKSGR